MTDDYFVAVAPDKTYQPEALALSLGLRRLGVATDLLYQRAKKSFGKAKDAGANEIIVVSDGGNCRWWRGEAFFTVTATVEEIIAYHAWVLDDLDELPDPRDELLLQNCYNEEFNMTKEEEAEAKTLIEDIEFRLATFCSEEPSASLYEIHLMVLKLHKILRAQ